MKKKYVTPEMEVIEMSTFGFLAASGDPDWGGPTGYEEKPQAPGMMSFDDDMDDTYEE